MELQPVCHILVLLTNVLRFMLPRGFYFAEHESSAYGENLSWEVTLNDPAKLTRHAVFTSCILQGSAVSQLQIDEGCGLAIASRPYKRIMRLLIIQGKRQPSPGENLILSLTLENGAAAFSYYRAYCLREQSIYLHLNETGRKLAVALTDQGPSMQGRHALRAAY